MAMKWLSDNDPMTPSAGHWGDDGISLDAFNAAVAQGNRAAILDIAANVDRKLHPDLSQKIMEMQAQQAMQTPGNAEGWWNQTNISPEAKAIGSRNWQQLNAESDAYEASENAYEGGNFGGRGTLDFWKAALATVGGVYGAGSLAAGAGAAGAGGGELAAGVGGIDSGSLSQIMGNGGYAGAAGAGGGALDISGGLDGLTAAGELGGVGGSGLGAEEMAKLVADAQAEIATGAAGAVGVGANGGTATTSLLQMLQNGGTAALNALKAVPGGVSLLNAVPGLLGAYASSRQSDNLSDLATKFGEYGGPSRARYEASFQPGFTMANDPGYQDALDQSAKATLHGLSVQGNPAGSPNAWAQSLQDNYQKTAYPALQQYRNQNAATSGIGAFNSAAPGLATGQLQSNANMYNGIGSAIGNVTNPTQSLADILKQYQEANGGGNIFKVAA